MKIKLLILLLMLSALCLVGCSDSSEQSTDGGASESQSAAVEEIIPSITLNQTTVVIGVGESFTLTASVENVENPEIFWEIDGDYDGEIVALSADKGTATLTAEKVGSTKVIVCLTVDGQTYYESVDVTVKTVGEVTLVLSDNFGFNDDGYFVRLSMLDTDSGDITTVVPSVVVWKNNKIVQPSDYSWTVENPDIVSYADNKLRSLSEGETTVTGRYTVDGVDYEICVAIEVYRPRIELDESFTVEIENLSALKINSEIKGGSGKVLYNDKSSEDKTVGSYDSQTGLITLNKKDLPTYSSELGEGRELTVETQLASYAISVDLYTKIITTKAEFDGMAELAKKAYPSSKAIWDGYFVLGADIIYDGRFNSRIADIDSLWAAVEGMWSNGGLYGFKGVFDGKGHKIEGITVENGEKMASIFGVLHIEGVIKNVAFTKANVGANSSFVCSAGGGSVENVYIQYDSMGRGTQHYQGDGVTINEYCGSFFGFKEPTATANVTNCVIDITKASINKNVAVKAVGSEFVAIKNVFVIGGSEAVRERSNATLSCSTVIEFVEDLNAQSRYKKFNFKDFWSDEGGVPIPKVIYDEICQNDVRFTDFVDFMISGTEYEFSVDNDYARITADSEAVLIKGGIVSVSDSALGGESVTFTVTSIFDETKCDTFTCDIAVVSAETLVDFTDGEEIAFYDITEKKVYFADLADCITGDVLYLVGPDFKIASYADDGEEAIEIIALTSEKMYKFNCLSVTKVISEAEDLTHIRRDYTVSSYGNAGCYDGIITGTFVMVNDIDCEGLDLPDTGNYWENSRGFGGTLDGRGYTVKNLTVSKNGLFGIISKAHIKNVRFTGVNYKPFDQGSYVALFGARGFNSIIENVEIEYVGYINGKDGSLYHTSALLFYDTTWDCQFKGLTLDISKLSGVKYITELYYNADRPYLSENKSVYSDLTVIVKSATDVPYFAYNYYKLEADDKKYQPITEYPEGTVIKDAEGNALGDN